MTQIITLDGRELIRADDTTAGVVWRNITGENFEGRPAEHAEYLEQLAQLVNGGEPLAGRLERLPG